MAQLRTELVTVPGVYVCARVVEGHEVIREWKIPRNGRPWRQLLAHGWVVADRLLRAEVERRRQLALF